MRILTFAFSAFIIGISGASPAVAQDAATAEAPQRAVSRIANQYICQFDASVSSSAVRAEAAKAAGPELGQILFTYSNAIRGFAVRLPATPQGSENAVARLKANNARISHCNPDIAVRAAIAPGGAAGGKPSKGQTTPWGVSRVGGPGDGSALANEAWIIDSGIDLTHPDLNVDAAKGYDFIDNDTVPQDGFGHGTHVAGIIGAINNSFGVVGVAAGVRVVPVRVLNNSGYGADSGVIAAIDYVLPRAIPGDVINLSLVADFPSTDMDNAVIAAADAGLFVTIAAGNSSANAGNYSPARVDHTRVFTVSAFGSRDTWASYSNFGNPPIDFGEPGSSINSTYKNGGYATLSGTSMAAPHLAGLLLLNPAAPKNGGSVKLDPDGSPDVIGVR